MKILSINAGSSSLKFTLFELPKTEAIASGVFEKIGLKDSFYTIKYDGEKTRKEVEPVKGCLYQYRKNVATASKGAYIATRSE